MRLTLTVCLVLAALAGPGPDPAAAQQPGPLKRIRGLDMGRVEAGRASVLFSATDAGGAAAEAAVLRVVEPLRAAGDFYAAQLGGDFRFSVALLSPRDWGLAGGPPNPLPWHSQPDRLIVLPVRSDLGPMMTGPGDSGGQVMDVVSLHQLGHIVTAVFFQPADFREPEPPVRWFDELLASYLAYAFMQERDPDLADFMEDYAREAIASIEPRFSTLTQYDAFRDGYLSSAQGAANMNWYHNAFNLEAAALYRKHGLGLIPRLRTGLPWDRIESWTTDELLGRLEELSPGFLAWDAQMAAVTRRRY